MVCAERYELGLMGSLLFIGQTVGAIFLTHWADVFGRKKAMIFHGAMYAVFIAMSTYATTILQVYVYIFLIGLLFVPRSSAIFTYIFEITPDKFHQDATLYVYVGDGITFVISGIFTMYTRDVFLYLIFLCVSTVIAVFILVVFLPESPKY